MGKKVPLVIYKGDERIVIGEADVDEENGNFVAGVFPDAPSEIKEALSFGFGGSAYSIGGRFEEVRAIPPLQPPRRVSMRNHSVSLFVTLRNETPEHGQGVLFRQFAAFADSLREHCSSVSVSTNDGTEDEDLATDPEGEFYHDEKTLMRVRMAIGEVLAGGTEGSRDVLIGEIISAILNEGILFRERRP